MEISGTLIWYSIIDICEKWRYVVQDIVSDMKICPAISKIRSNVDPHLRGSDAQVTVYRIRCCFIKPCNFQLLVNGEVNIDREVLVVEDVLQ